MTSTPCSRKVRTMRGVTPKPAAEFSTLTMVRSASCCLRSRGSSACTALRPGSPKTSPTQMTVSGLVMWFWGGAAPLLPQSPPPHSSRGGSPIRVGEARSLGHFHRARLADHDDLDVPGILHLGLDALGDVLGELVRVEVGDLLGLGHDAELAAGLDGVAHLHALVGHGDLLELGKPLDVALQHVSPGPRTRRGDAVGRFREHRLDGLRLYVLV